MSVVRILRRVDSDDGSAKYLIALDDGRSVEAVYLYEPVQRSFGVCLSTQVGCNMGCVFCATARQRRSRNLSADEIVEQALVIAKDNHRGAPFRYVTLAGMGEPLDNFANSVSALKCLSNSRELALSDVSISTIGIASRLRDLLDDPDVAFRIYLSLHAPNDDLRARLMPGTRSSTLCGAPQRVSELTRLLDQYGRKLGDRWKARVSYLLLKGINDSPVQLEELCRLLDGKMISVQLLFWNPVEHAQFRRDGARIPLDRVSDDVGRHWVAELERRGISAYAMPSYGRDIRGGCGQLATRNLGQPINLIRSSPARVAADLSL